MILVTQHCAKEDTAKAATRHQVNLLIKNKVARQFALLSRISSGLALLAFIGSMVGCTTSGFPLTGGTPPPTGYAFLTGNWVIQATSPSNSNPFTSLDGYVDEQSGDVGVNDLTTAALQAQQPSSCYLGATLIPLQGALQATSLGLRSFSVNGQFVTVTATKDATASHLTGTYSISGGCADGVTGTLTGTKYGVLTGIYKGSVSVNIPAETIQLTLAQNVNGSGEGLFLETGSAIFTGFSCFTKGTIASGASSIIGNQVSLDIATDDASGAKLLLTGTLNTAANLLSISSGTITGGSCAGPVSAASLALQ